MSVARLVRIILLALVLAPVTVVTPVLAADFDNPLAAIAANPELSDIYALVKKNGFAEPLGVGGDITFLALSNRLLSETTKGSRFTNIELFRDKIPPEAQLLILQAMTLDGQYTPTQFEELIGAQGSGKPELVSVLGKEVKYRLYRGKSSGTYILEDTRHNGMLIKGGSEIVTQNGTVIVVDAAADIPK